MSGTSEQDEREFITRALLLEDWEALDNFLGSESFDSHSLDVKKRNLNVVVKTCPGQIRAFALNALQDLTDEFNTGRRRHRMCSMDSLKTNSGRHERSRCPNAAVVCGLCAAHRNKILQTIMKK